MPDERFETGRAWVFAALDALVTLGFITVEQRDLVVMDLLLEDMEGLTHVYHGVEGIFRVDADIRRSYLQTHIYNKSVLQTRMRQHVGDQHARRVFLSLLLGEYSTE